MVNYKNRNRIKSKCWSAKGFTLLELVMVSVIVIFMAFIVVPHIVQNKEKGSHQRDCYKLLAWAQWAQSRAITEQRPYQIEFNVGSKTYTIQRYDGYDFVDIETVSLEPSTYIQLWQDTFLTFNHFGINVDPSGAPVSQYESIALYTLPEWYFATVYVAENGRIYKL